MAAVHSIIPGGDEAKQPSLITDVNSAVAQCHATPITIIMWPIIPEDLRWTCFTDSGFDTSEKARHQQGWVVGATNKYLNQGRSAPISVIHWRSRKLPRKAGSPQLVETYAASSAVVEMAWIKALWESMTWRDFNLLTQRRDTQHRKGTLTMPFVVRDPNPSWTDPESTLVMDSKGLYDSLDNELPQDDKTSALEVHIILEFL